MTQLSISGETTGIGANRFGFKFLQFWKRIVRLAVLCLCFDACPLLCAADPSDLFVVPDQGWHLWPDTNAAWKEDAIYLPGEFELAKMPVNKPSGGWGALNRGNGITVTLPSTVEEHFWGKFGLRPYTADEYDYSTKGDLQVLNGNYLGVSWWWQDVVMPKCFSNKVVLLNIRGARQRAEVFVNHQLVGYDLIAETSFRCDISKAIRPGTTNQIAIRITNPGGRLDWRDKDLLKWGREIFDAGHGFGGLDRGISITAQDMVYVADSWVLNTPEIRTVTAHASVRNETGHAQHGVLQFKIINPKDHSVLATAGLPFQIAAHTNLEFQSPLTCEQAELWDLEQPKQYTMESTLHVDSPVPMKDTAAVSFGFRWFEPRGIGRDAGLYLNGRRVRLYTAISWGFWAFNGLWPTPELAEKEVHAAKELGLNMLNFHRDIGKEDVLAAQDRLGLLRYMEAGGGWTAMGKMSRQTDPAPSGILDVSGKGGEADTFAKKYEEIRIERMVRQFRSHPALVIYVIQNEWEPDLADPRVFNVIQKMHALDPSRIIAAKSGITPKHQVWFAPYESAPRHDDGTGFSGWRDEHTVGGPGVWLDEMYKNPTNFTHRIVDSGEIVDWGEMLGAAVADNHPLMVQQIVSHGGKSYDLDDHQRLATAYDQFLERWGFREAFPTDEMFYSSLGNKCYEFWSKVIETARLAEDNDILTISGWESTAIENHSGLVDNQRNFKGDPSVLAPKLAPLLPVAKPRNLVCRVGDQPLADLFLLNETGKPSEGKIHLRLISPDDHAVELGGYDAPAYQENHFVYPVDAAVQLPALDKEGKYTLQICLDGKAKVTNSETILVLNALPKNIPALRIGVVGNLVPFQKQWSSSPQVKVLPYREELNYDLVIAAAEPMGKVLQKANSARIKNTKDEFLYKYHMQGTSASDLRFHFSELPPGKVTVTLYFCEKWELNKGDRAFDVVINGQTVLTNFDLTAEAGRYAAVEKTFTVNAPEGIVDIYPSSAARFPALINAIKLEAGAKTVAVLCGGKPQKDHAGLLWKPYTPEITIPDSVQPRVRAGMPLVIIPADLAAADRAARWLSKAGALTYHGDVPSSRDSWMGNWIFVKKHPLFAGLPTNEVLHGDYQIPVGECYGLQIDGPAVEIVAGYGRDHDANLGAMAFTTRIGKGKVIFQALSGMPQVIRERLWNNALLDAASSK